MASPEQEKVSLQDMFGVTSRSHEKWMTDCSAALSRMRGATEIILRRELRESAEKLCSTIEDIVENCRMDPQDIREEIALPAILRRTAEVLEQYSQVVSSVHLHPDVEQRLNDALDMVEEANPALQELLSRMRSNDDKDFSQRARVMSSVFRRFPRKEEE